MLKIFCKALILTVLLFLTNSGFGQADLHYRSQCSGSWNDPQNWLTSSNGEEPWATAIVQPTSASNTITITGNHVIEITDNNSDADQLIIEALATLVVKNEFIVRDGAEVDLSVSGTLIIKNRLTMQGRAVIQNGGHYIQYVPDFISLPSLYYTWAEGSTLKLVVTSTTTPFTILNINQHFYNFIWDGSAQTSDVALKLNSSFQVDGKMEVQSTANKSLILTASEVPVTLNFNGDFEIKNSSIVTLSSNIGQVTMNIDGNLSIANNIGAAHLRMGNTTTSPNNRINLSGNLNVNNIIAGINYNSNYSTGTICFANASSFQTISNLGRISRVNYIINPNVTVSSPTFNVDNRYTLTIKDNGSLITNSPVYATVERQVSNADWDVPLDGWHLLSSPVNGQSMSSGGFLSDPYDLYAWSEPANTWLNQKVAGNNISFFENGQGYFVAYDNGGIKSFQGSLNVTSQTFNNLTLSETSAYSGYHLLGNPFASAINWDHSAWNRQQISEVAVVWNENAMNYLSITSANPVIPSCQGFFIQVMSPSNSLTIPANARIQSSVPFNKEIVTDVLQLRVRGKNHKMYDETIIRFIDDSSEGFDKFDGRKMAGSEIAPQLYTAIKSVWNSQSENLSVNTIPFPVEYLRIPLLFRPGMDDTYSLEVMINSINESVWLEDKISGIVSELINSTPYTFKSGKNDATDRFILHFRKYPQKSLNSENFIISSAGNTVFIRDISSNVSKQLNYKVISMSGKTIIEGSGKGPLLKISKPALASGIYIITVTGDDQSTYTSKIIL